jgi:hypothetical protein
MFTTLVDIPPGSDVVVQFRLRSTRPPRPYHLDFLAQPTARPDLLRVSVTDQSQELLEKSLTVRSNVRLDGAR